MTAVKICSFLASVMLLIPAIARADMLTPFSAEYEARYGGLRAEAVRSLQITGEGEYEMRTQLELKLLGRTVSSIDERSVLGTVAGSEAIRPLAYSFNQTGLGKRTRQVSFDWDKGTAFATTGGQDHEITLEANVADNLSAYIEVRRQLLSGARVIAFPGIDKGELQEFRYNVMGEEHVVTDFGLIRTLKLERVREPGTDRATEMWLAPDWDYLLVKLVQQEPGASIISLDLTRAIVGERAVTAGPASSN